jgi:hypothetical protein
MNRAARREDRRGLTPEEDAIADPDDDDGIDDLLPGDLWFRARGRGQWRRIPVY